MNPTQIRMVGLSVFHEGEPDKPNEDALFFEEEKRIALLADGVSRSRNKDGSYPSDFSTLAPLSFVRVVAEALRASKEANAEKKLRHAFFDASVAIQDVNSRLGIVPSTVDYEQNDYFGTTALAAIFSEDAQEESVIGTLAFIGDPLAILVSRNACRLLTRDQLAACHRFSRPYFKGMVDQGECSHKEMTPRRLFWQRARARNNSKTQDPAGNKVGFGVLTGEESALPFVEALSFKLSVGDRLLLATDALKACKEGDDPESGESYRSITTLVRQEPLAHIPELLIARIRRCEKERTLRSDDATIIAIELR